MEYNAPASTRFAYDGAQIASEVANPSGAPLRRYVYGPGDDEPLVWYEGTGTTDKRWLVQDERGSVVAVTNASGLATAINSYDEYGIPAATNIGRFQYTGQAWLPEIGLYYYKARMYSPTLGRFLQTDPIGYADGLNWYNYVGSDPVNGRDPSGLAEDDIEVTAKRLKETASFSNFDLGGTGGFSFGSSDPCSGPRGVLCDGGGVTSGEAGEILVTAARVGKRGTPGAAPVPQNGHRYVVNRDSQCSADTVFNNFKQPGVSAPGAPAAREGFTPRVTLAGGNYISQSVNSSTRTIVNTTIPPHIFYPGTVSISVTPNVGGGSRIEIVGTGSGNYAALNDVAGELIFGQAAAAAGGGCGSTSYTPVRGG